MPAKIICDECGKEKLYVVGSELAYDWIITKRSLKTNVILDQKTFCGCECLNRFNERRFGWSHKAM